MSCTVKNIMREKGAIDKEIIAEDWKGYRVYNAIFDRPNGCYGLPEFVLEDKTGNAKRATYDEIMNIMDYLIEQDDTKWRRIVRNILWYNIYTRHGMNRAFLFENRSNYDRNIKKTKI